MLWTSNFAQGGIVLTSSYKISGLRFALILPPNFLLIKGLIMIFTYWKSKKSVE